MTLLRDHLVERIAGGRKLLVPYVMAGLPDAGSWPRTLAAFGRYADAIEIGLPYSDPLMDGPVIVEAGERVIRAGIGPAAALDLAAQEAGAPRIVMTYYNPVHRIGEAEFCRRAGAGGVAGLIVPDLPVEESESLRAEAAANAVAWVPLVAPTSSVARVRAITSTATGFVYAVSTLGVTGVRESLSGRAAEVVARCREATDLPVLVGIGVSTPEQAVEAASAADGVVIGSALVRAILREGVFAAESFLRDVRAALDSAVPSRGAG
jgi:tryptophan synthase alpha chain